MLVTIVRLDKLAAARAIFRDRGMMQGTTLTYTAMILRGEVPRPLVIPEDLLNTKDDHGAVNGPKVLSSIELATSHSMYNIPLISHIINSFTVRSYPKHVTDLAKHIQQPRLPELIRHFLFDQLYADNEHSSTDIPLNECPYFTGRIFVYHSAVARFYAPSDLCGAGGMYHERFRSAPAWQGDYARRDTVFIVTDSELPGMLGMCIGRILLLFSFVHDGSYYPCALVHWFTPVNDTVDDETGLWVVKPEFTGNGQRNLAVVHVDCIARAAHLSAVFGRSLVPDDLQFSSTLDVFRSYFVNTFADHHTHEFLT